MNAPDLFQLLERYAPEFGVEAFIGSETAWAPYFRELREFRGPAIESAMEAWRRGEFAPDQPMLADIFPRPDQLAFLARRSQLLDVRLPLSPQEVAAQLRAMADENEEDVL